MVRGTCVATAFVIALGQFAIAGANDLEICKSDSKDSNAIAACSRIIAKGDANKENLYDAYYERGMKQRYNRQFDQAIDDFSKAIALTPDNLWAYVARGHAYAYKKDFARAFADQETAIRKKPNEVTYTGRAVDLIEAGDYDRAIADLNEALRINAKYFYGYFWRGELYLKKGDFGKAEADYQTALGIKPEDQQAKDGLKNARARKTH